MTNLLATLLITVTTNWTNVGFLDGQYVYVGYRQTNRVARIKIDDVEKDVIYKMEQGGEPLVKLEAHNFYAAPPCFTNWNKTNYLSR